MVKKISYSAFPFSEPNVLLLDECFAALDVLTIKMLQEIIVNLQKKIKLQSVYVIIKQEIYWHVLMWL